MAAVIAREVDEQIRGLELAAERHLAAAGSAVRGAAAERDLLAAAEGARDFLATAVRGEKATLSELFGGHNCQRWERLRELIDRVELPGGADKRWQNLRDVVETTECVLRQLGTFKGLAGPRGAWPTLGPAQRSTAGRPPATTPRPEGEADIVACGDDHGDRGGEAAPEPEPEEEAAQPPSALGTHPRAIQIALSDCLSVEGATWRVAMGEDGQAKAELVFSMRERRDGAQGAHGDRASALNFGLKLPKMCEQASAAALEHCVGRAPEEVPEDVRSAEEKEQEGEGAAEEVRTEASTEASAEAPTDAPTEAPSEAPVELLAQGAAEAPQETCGQGAIEAPPAEAVAEAAAPTLAEAGSGEEDKLASSSATLDGGVVYSRNLSYAWGGDGGRADDAVADMQEQDEEELASPCTSTLDLASEALGVRSRMHVEVAVEPVEVPVLPAPVPVSQPQQSPTLGHRCLVAEPVGQGDASAECAQRLIAARKQRSGVEVPVELVPRAGAATPAPSQRQQVQRQQQEQPQHCSSMRGAGMAASPRAAATIVHPPLVARLSSAGTLPMGAATPVAPTRCLTLPRDPSAGAAQAFHRSASPAAVGYPAGLSSLPRHCPPLPVAPARRNSAASLVMPASSPPAGGAPAFAAAAACPATPPALHRALPFAGAQLQKHEQQQQQQQQRRTPVQRMESAPSSTLRGVLRRETGHWEERRVVEVRTERTWVPHKREEIEL